MQQRLKPEELSKLKKMAKAKNYDAIVALLDYQMAEALNKLVECSSDHRWHQASFSALKAFRESIVPSTK